MPVLFMPLCQAIKAEPAQGKDRKALAEPVAHIKQQRLNHVTRGLRGVEWVLKGD